MFEIANARERQMLALDAAPPAQDETHKADEIVLPEVPTPEAQATSPKYWAGLWLGGD